MPLQFTVSPDFGPNQLAGWHFFNTWLQRQLDEGIHFQQHDSFDQQHQAIQENHIDIIYANPYDAALLVRDKGFLAIAKPDNKPDEAMIVVATDSPIDQVEDFSDGVTIAATDDPDVRLMGKMMLEPAFQAHATHSLMLKDSYILVAKEVLNGTCQAGFFLKDAFEELSSLVRNQLRSIVTSEIQLIQHVLLISPSFVARQAEISELLLDMHNQSTGEITLESLNIKRWLPLPQEEVEFMIDLMHALDD